MRERANLLLIRAVGRKREFPIRAALGASRGRVIRQLLLESGLLSLAGGALGLAASNLGVRLLLAITPGNIPRIGHNGSAVGVDGHVLIFTLAVTVLTALLFGLMPALQSSRADLGLALKERGRSGTVLRQKRTRAILVISETALAVILLIGSALLIRSFAALRAVGPGFDPHNVLTLRTSLAGTRFNRTAGVARLVHDGVQAITTLPGVAAAAASTALPLEGSSGLPFDIVSHPLAGGAVRVGWTGLFRRFPNSDRARARLYRPQRPRGARRGDHQPGDGAAVLAELGSDRGADHDRPGLCARVR